jgi:hypothetical protein
MFKRHVYTCPDIIHLRNRQKKIYIANTAMLVVFIAGSFLVEKYQDRKLARQIASTPA